jgi:hypothetical protein
MFCVVGGFITWIVAYLYYKKQMADYKRGKDEEIARYVVLAMLPQHPIKDSNDLQERIGKYLDALERTKKDKRGVPVYRQDGLIGVDWNLSATENLNLSDSLTKVKKKQQNTGCT